MKSVSFFLLLSLWSSLTLGAEHKPNPPSASPATVDEILGEGAFPSEFSTWDTNIRYQWALVRKKEWIELATTYLADQRKMKGPVKVELFEKLARSIQDRMDKIILEDVRFLDSYSPPKSKIPKWKVTEVKLDEGAVTFTDSEGKTILIRPDGSIWKADRLTREIPKPDWKPDYNASQSRPGTAPVPIFPRSNSKPTNYYLVFVGLKAPQKLISFGDLRRGGRRDRCGLFLPLADPFFFDEAMIAKACVLKDVLKLAVGFVT